MAATTLLYISRFLLGTSVATATTTKMKSHSSHIFVPEDFAAGATQNAVAPGRKPFPRILPAFYSKQSKASLDEMNRVPHQDFGNNLGADHGNIICEQTSSSSSRSRSNGRERLKRHREEVSGRISIPEKWGKEELLRDWMDYTSFDALLAPKGLASAREALMVEARRSGASPHRRLRI